MADSEAVTKPVEAGEEKPVDAGVAATEEKPAEETTAAADEKPADEAVEAGQEKPAEEASETKDEKPATESETTSEKKDTDMIKTKAAIDYENTKNNVKFDPSTQEETDDPEQIRKQVEFYFGDWNFPQDKFMWESCGGGDNRPLLVKTLHSFKRMRRFQPYSALIAAIKDSTFLDLQGEEGKETVKRKKAYLPKTGTRAQSEASTVYVKGFGDETATTQYDLETFFGKFADVKGLKLRRTNEGLFKGSVFVTFHNEETAKKYIEQDPAPKWEEHDLKIMSKSAYCQEKSDLIRDGKLEPNNHSQKKFFEGKDSSNQRHKNGGKPRDRDDWKNRRDNDQKNGFRGGRGGGRGRGGRGRGGRGGGGRGGGRGGDRRSDRREQDPDRISKYNDVKPAIHTSPKNKRAREDDNGADAPAAKKVDTKSEE